jgi:hypothetical protein
MKTHLSVLKLGRVSTTLSAILQQAGTSHRYIGRYRGYRRLLVAYLIKVIDSYNSSSAAMGRFGRCRCDVMARPDRPLAGIARCGKLH